MVSACEFASCATLVLAEAFANIIGHTNIQYVIVKVSQNVYPVILHRLIVLSPEVLSTLTMYCALFLLFVYLFEFNFFCHFERSREISRR